MNKAERDAAVTDAFMKKAVIAATTAVERATTLRGATARTAADAALIAGSGHIRTAHTAKLAGGATGEALTAMVLAVGTLVLDLSTLGYIAVRGSHRQRAAVAVSVAGHVAVFALMRYRERRITAAARAELEAAGDRVAA